MIPTIQMIPLYQLVNADSNPRTDLVDVDQLGESIAEFGILQPLVVRETTLGFEIIAGHRRAAAAAQAGLDEVPCVIRDDTGDLSVHHLVENTQRVDLRPFEIAQGIGRALATKIRQKDLAKHLGRSEAWVSKFKTISQAYDKAAAANHPSDCAALAAATDADEAYKLAQLILDPKKVKAPKDDQEQGDGEQADAVDNAASEAIIKMIEKGCEKAKISYPGVVFDTNGGNYCVALAFDDVAKAKKFFKLLT